MANEPRLELLKRYVDGVASPKEVVLLEQAIKEDSAFRIMVVEYMHIDSALEAMSVAEDSTFDLHAFIPNAPVTSARSRRLRSPISWLVATAVTAAAAFALLTWWNVPKDRGVRMQVMESTSRSLQADTQIRIHSLQLAEGEVRLKLASDVVVRVSSPSKLQFLNTMHLSVLYGKVTADVGEHGKGFIIDTPNTRVVDLGTRFGVDARGDGSTDVVVFSGVVELHELGANTNSTPIIRLEQGQAVSLREQRQLARIDSIIGSANPEEWSRGDVSSQGLITSVTDNVAGEADWFFHRIQPNALRPGAFVHVDRPHTWEAVQGEDFPSSLLDADLVQTFRGARRIRRLELELRFSRPGLLYLLMPDRGERPDWLVRDFIPTGESVALQESLDRPKVRESFTVWKREIDQADYVKLGPAPRDANGNATIMYGIAAKPMPLQGVFKFHEQ
ncbi:MAG: FecR family protein [Pirellulaceae bacterium]|nr:FecR family protein [Pirellulaceae bacterium]